MALVSRPFRRKGLKTRTYYVKWRVQELDPATGQMKQRQILRSTKTSDRKLANEVRDQIEQELARRAFGMESKNRDMFPKDAWQYYADHITNVGELHLIKTKGTFLHFFEVIKCPTLASVKPTDVLAYQRQRLKDGVKPITINNCVSICRTVYRNLIQWDVLHCDDPFEKIKRLALPKERPLRWRSWETMQELLNTCLEQANKAETEEEKENWIALYLFCLLCTHLGLRRTEAIMSRWDDHVDWERNLFKPPGTKSRRASSPLPLHPSLKAALEPFRRDSGFIIAPSKTVVHALRPWQRWDYEKWWNKLKALTKFDGSPHTMRHSYATHLLETGHSDVDVVLLMRHENLDMTSHYADIRALVPQIRGF